MTWEEPTRDVRLARERAIKLLEIGQLFCVWSGRRLSAVSVDVDHCFPWSAWPCGDLWNLMPAHRAVNQNEKRSRLPTDRLLRASSDRITDWWHSGYTQDQPSLRERFWLEAEASLPGIQAEKNNLQDLFEAVSLQRLKLRQDQQVPEWAGENYVAATGHVQLV